MLGGGLGVFCASLCADGDDAGCVCGCMQVEGRREERAT